MASKYDVCHDEIVSTRDIQFMPGNLDNPIGIKVQNSKSLDLQRGCLLTPWAVGQICARFGIRPWVVWTALTPDLTSMVLNEITLAGRTKKYLIRVFNGVVRAVVSDKWRPVDNKDLLSALAFELGPDIVFEESEYNERFVGYGSVNSAAGVIVYGSEVGSLHPYAAPYVNVGNVIIPITCLGEPLDMRRKELTPFSLACDMIDKARFSHDRAITHVKNLSNIRVSQDVKTLVRSLCSYVDADERIPAAYSAAKTLAANTDMLTALVPIQALAKVVHDLPILEVRIRALEGIGKAVTDWQPPKI